MGPNLIYRMRSTQRLLKDKELQDQYMYFASVEELNDPMENLRDFVWRGDEVVWENFIKHYLRCLQMFFISYLVLLHHCLLTPNHVRVHKMPNMPDYFDERGKAIFDELCRNVFAKAQVTDLISHVAHRAIRKDELVHYLTSIHTTAVVEVHNLFAKYQIGQVGELMKPPTTQIPTGFFHNFFYALNKIDKGQVGVMFEIVQQLQVDLNLQTKRTLLRPSSLYERNRNTLLLDFPVHYIQRIESLVYPRWYAACFSNVISNSSLWGHYGDGHKGVCLIFDTEEDENGEFISLTQEHADFDFATGEYGSPSSHVMRLHFRRVEYSDKLLEFDFFRNLGTVSVGELMKEWYTGSDGTVSSSASHIGGGTLRWQEQRWEAYDREIHRKNIDWKYEEESRLVLKETLRDLQPRQFRKLRYGFDSLHGLVFGINTAEEDKIAVIDVIEKKCKEHGRSEFAYYQAYYAPREGSVEARRIRFG